MSTFLSLPPPHPPAKAASSPAPPPTTPAPGSSAVAPLSSLPSSSSSPVLPAPAPPPRVCPPSRRWQAHCSLEWFLRRCPSELHRQPLSSVLREHLKCLLRLRVFAGRLRYPVRVFVTACSLYHDFFIHQSLQWHEAWHVAVTALFLAGKAEDAPRRLHDVVHADLYPPPTALEAEWPEKAEEHASLGATSDAEPDASDPASPTASPYARTSASGSVIDLSPAHPPPPEADERNRSFRLKIIHLENELLLSCDFNFSVPQPTGYIVRALREMTRRRREEQGNREGGQRGVVEEVGWRVETEVVWRRMEDVFCTAMEVLLLAMISGVCLVFSPRAIAVACIHLASLHHRIDLPEVAAASGFTSPLPPPPPSPPSAMEDVAHQVSSPSSSASVSPCSPMYAESPSSPSTCSPASLESLSSSASTVAPGPTAVVESTPSVSDPPQPSPLPPPPPWHRALVSDLSDEDLSLLCQRILPEELSTLSFSSSALATSLRRDFWPFPIRVRTASKGGMDRELVDLVNARREYEQLLVVRVREEEERRVVERQKAEEERRMREQEMREMREREAKLEEERRAKEAREAQLWEEQRRARERERDNGPRLSDGQLRRPPPAMADTAAWSRTNDRPAAHHGPLPSARVDAMPPRRDGSYSGGRRREARSRSREQQRDSVSRTQGPSGGGRPTAPLSSSSSSTSSSRPPRSPPRRPRSRSRSSTRSPQSPSGSRYGGRGHDGGKRRRTELHSSHPSSSSSTSSHSRSHRRSSSRSRSSSDDSEGGSRAGSSRRRRRSPPRAYADHRDRERRR